VGLPVGRLGIVGLGLIGGSLAARAVRTWPEMYVVGIDAPEVCEAALARGLIHETSDRVEALGDVDLIVLAAPIDGIVEAIGRLGTAQVSATVTDVGSTKRVIMDAASSAGLKTFIGGHPMAGAETTGLQNHQANLFDGRTWALVPGDGVGDDRLQDLEWFVRGMGATPHRVAADVHDHVVAYVSHLPQLLAVALMRTVGERCGEEGLQLAGRALGDMSRLAASPVDLWQGILRSNTDCIVDACREFVDRLPRDAAALTDTLAVAKLFGDAQNWRTRLDRRQ
jgi:prephenate dehydrogenase